MIVKIEKEIEIFDDPEFCGCGDDWCKQLDDKDYSDWCYAFSYDLETDYAGALIKHEKCKKIYNDNKNNEDK